MGDWPTTMIMTPTVICPYSEESIGPSQVSGPTSQTVVQNQAYYFPFRLDVEETAVKMCVLNGATSNGNLDVGIYDGQFNYLISSGATAQGTANQLQELNITDTALKPGLYWMAFSSSSATATMFFAVQTDEIAHSMSGVYVQASAHPLPTTVATPIKSTATSVCVAMMIGVAFDTLI